MGNDEAAVRMLRDAARERICVYTNARLKMDIEIPADTRTVTLALEERRFTLRSLLPHINSDVVLVVMDMFEGGDADLYRLKAGSGDSLMRSLKRSRVVDGEALLDLTPDVRLAEPQPTLLNGSLVTLSGTGAIQLVVTPPAQED